MERVFFIDYENVDTAGLDGLGRLNSNDTVYIYYSEKHSRMTFGLHRRITESPASFQYRKIKGNTKNYLDNELMKEAGKFISDTRADYYIISKDKGYESFVKEKKKAGFRTFLLVDIKMCNEVKLDWLRSTVKNRLVKDSKAKYNLTDEQISKIAKWILEANNKSELNNHLQELFYNDDVKYIFTRLRDLTYNL